MTAFALRILIGLVVVAAIYFGVRRIWRDWQKQFRVQDQERRKRDLAERDRPDVIELKRDGDGVYRPDRDERR